MTYIKKIVIIILTILLTVGCTKYFTDVLSDNDTQYVPAGLQEHFDISPDDANILFSYNKNGKVAIYESDITGGNIRKLSNPKKNELHIKPRYSSDANKILYLSTNSDHSQSQLIIIDRNRKEERKVITEYSMIQEAVFSYDSESIYYVEAKEYRGLPLFAGPYGPVNLDLYVMNLDGTEKKQLTDIQKDFIFNIIVENSGKEVLFITSHHDEPYSNQLYSTSTKVKSKLNHIKIPKIFIAGADISSNNKFLVVAAESITGEIFSDSEIFLFDKEESQLKKLTSIQSTCLNPRFFHHENSILFIEDINKSDSDDPNFHLWKLDLSSNALDKIDFKF